MQLAKRSRWIIISAILLTALAVFITHVDDVQATFSNVHVVTVWLRVETEIMQKTLVGRYYESLFWKHSDELTQIYSSDHPERIEEFLRINRLFVPDLEALLDGKGDTVRINAEQVDSLKAELDWLASVGSPSLREDIQKEQQRFPLDKFVGVTFSDALDFINSSWTPDRVIQQTSTPNSFVQPTLALQLVVNQTLVPGTNGKLAYYVHNGVYLEYPADYYLQLTESDTRAVDLIPSISVPEREDLYSMGVVIYRVPANEKNGLDPSKWDPPVSVVWENVIQEREFEGTEFIIRRQNESVMTLCADLYNQESQLAVHIYVYPIHLIPGDSNYLALINQRYPYFQHLVDTLRLQRP